MNKSEKLICVLLGLALVLYFVKTTSDNRKAEEARQVAVARRVQAARAAAEAAKTETAKPEATKPAASAEPVAVQAPALPAVPERTDILENADVKLELSSWGGDIRRATMKGYAKGEGEVSETNPALTLDFSNDPVAKLSLPGSAAVEAYEVKSISSNEIVYAGAAVTRKITLGENYLVTVEDVFANPAENAANTMSVGTMGMGSSKNDILSVDSWADPFVNASGKNDGDKVIHHCEGDSPLAGYLVGGLGGGCGCGGSGSSASAAPVQRPADVAGPQRWIAVKNRFFVSALASCDEANVGFSSVVRRDMTSKQYRPGEVSVAAKYASIPAKRTSVFYIGPKKQSLLWDLGMKDVMEFGMWRVICYPLVWILNFFHGIIPNYGIAIILLTILVRLVFWPLQRKSTVGMKKMQELQPKMQEIKEKFKDNPQRMQQETWALYRDNKVNPLSSCLPMLVQIPVFVALFNVLRSAVELRYAGFLWIADLSEPEGLLQGVIPWPESGINLLPILMAATTALQSWLTPSGGDEKQKRMMAVMMPLMMLFMFYQFPSALSLYWAISNVLMIVQMWFIRRETAKKQRYSMPTEIIDPPNPTRQQRRHG